MKWNPSPVFRLVVGLITAVTVAIPVVAEPCSCITISGSGDGFTLQDYEAVFQGEVLSVRWVNLPHSDGTYRLIQAAAIEVSDFWKGRVAPVVVVFTGNGAGDCGFDFVPGTTYVVFAERIPKQYREPLHANRNALWTDICTPSSNAERAPDLLKKLNELTDPERYQTFDEIY